MSLLLAILAALAALFFCGAFLLLPLAAMALSTIATPDGLSLSAFAQILADPVDRSQLLNSVGLGTVATAIAFFFGCGHAFLTLRTDVPGARFLGPLGILPLVVPPIFVAMGFADFSDVAGFWPCALLLGVSYAPFVAVLAARGLRSIDGRLFEAAFLARGSARAHIHLFRMAVPEIVAGCLFAFVFVLSEHGVPEFLTVKGKTWHTYAEGVFARWTRRATGVEHDDLVSPIVAALPLVAIIAVALWFALRLRAHTTIRSNHAPLPIRRFGKWRFAALLLPLTYLTCGVVVPVVVMARWAAGSTQVEAPVSVATMQRSFHAAIAQAGDDLTSTLLVGIATGIIAIAIGLPIALAAARRQPWLQHVVVVAIAVPAILLGMGLVQVFNSRLLADHLYAWTGDFYDSAALLACAFAARFLPFAVLTLTHAARRSPVSLDEAAELTGRSPIARFLHIRLPLLAPAGWSAACLMFILALRELDLAVLLPAGNDTVVRRLSNVVHFGGEDMGGALALLLLTAAVLVPLVTVLVTGKKLETLS